MQQPILRCPRRRNARPGSRALLSPPAALARALAALLLALLVGPVAAREGAEVPLHVFVSVLPLQTFVERVGGDRVVVKTLVLPGQSPATYDPTPKQIAALADADLYVRVGVPFERAWMPRIRAANPHMAMLDLRDGLPLRATEAHDHDAEGDAAHAAPRPHASPAGDADRRDALDPHIWTSPRLVRHMAAAIRDTLSRLDPDGAAAYAARQAAFDAELAALDRELADTLAHLDSRRFLVFHPAWGYFADAYGLTQIPIEREGKSPGARRLTALIEQARAEGARVVFVQPQFDRRAAQRVARAIGGRVEAMDPLAPDYAANLRRVAALIAGAGGSGGATASSPAAPAGTARERP
jgi:zinc transport system substrate-binding protein